MATNLEFLLPRFGQEQWTRITSPASAGTTRTVSLGDTFIRERRLYDVLDPAFKVIAREAKPTMWAHAEMFQQALTAEMARETPDPDGEHFQAWGGLLAALFQGDLQSTHLATEAIQALDEDLAPALQGGLPFRTDANWPEVLYRLHEGGGISLLSSVETGAVVGGCYAPCLVFPALAAPAQSEPFELSPLMQIYCRQAGFAQAFHLTLSRLGEQLAARQGQGFFTTLQRAVDLLRNLLRSRYEASRGLPEPSLQELASSPLGYRFVSDSAASVGNVGHWQTYPLRVDLGNQSSVLFIAEEIDTSLNPWALGLAFPGTADRTRFCDLSVQSNPDHGRPEVHNTSGKVYEVASNMHVLSLSPSASAAHKVVLEAVFYFEGDNALDPALLHAVHGKWRTDLSTRDDVTPLLPLHVNLLRYFPRYIANPGDLVQSTSGGIGGAAATEANCKLQLPLPAGAKYDPLRSFAWKARLISWKLTAMQLPAADVWPAFRARHTPRWSAYFVRLRLSSGRLGLFFHGEDGIRDRPAAPTVPEGTPDDAPRDPYTVYRLTSPPRLAEVFIKDQVQDAPHGLLFLSAGIYREVTQQTEAWRVAVDLGTSNTSVAVDTARGSRNTLTFQALAAPLVYPPPAKRPSALPFPGWFLQGAPEESFHRGFFPTLLGYRTSLARDRSLLAGLANPGKQSAADFGDLIGAFDLIGIKGDFALDVRRSKLLKDTWGVEDNLKWASPGDNPEQEIRRRAFRQVFLELLLLHLDAEAYVYTGLLPERYTFTFPLSMRSSDVELYFNAARRAVEVVEQLACPPTGGSSTKPAVDLVNESQALYRAYSPEVGGEHLPPGQRVVLIDMGGGSADYTVFTGAQEDDGRIASAQLCFLDSMVLAGNRFFEFLSDITTDKEYQILTQSWAEMLPNVPELAGRDKLREPSTIDDLRQLYTLRVGSLMEGKSPSFEGNNDIKTLSIRETAVAEQLARKLDQYAPGHWMRSLFNVVLTHGLLLAIAPLPGRRKLSGIHVVLAGNGWGLLPHAAVMRSPEKITAVVKALYKDLKRVVESLAAPDPTPALPSPDNIKVSFMDRVAAEVLHGNGVFSKDMVAAGGLLAKESDRIVPSKESKSSLAEAGGIVGFDLPVMAMTSTGSGAPPSSPIVLPWHASVRQQAVIDYILEEVMKRPSANGQGRDALEEPKITRLDPAASLHSPSEGPQSVYQQLVALHLVKTGGYVGSPREMLNAMDWETWNTNLYAKLTGALEVYGAATTERIPDNTSLIRSIWEYPFLSYTVRRTLFQTMSGGA